MNKPRIIIVDTDFSYVEPLQLKFIESLFNKIELEVITTKEYFKEFLEYPQKADILIIDKSMYSANVQKHEFNNIFLLSESHEETEEYSMNVTILYKYTSIKEIFAIIEGKTDGMFLDDSRNKLGPQIIVVTSTLGGVGKTSVSFGIAANLAKKFKKVLYINSDCLQTFQTLLINKTPIMDNEVYMNLSSDSKRAYRNVKHLIRKEIFDYLPPFKNSLLAYGLSQSVFTNIAIQARDSDDYDFIIMDTDSIYNENKVKVMNIADKVIYVLTQNEMAVESTNYLVKNVNIMEDEKYLFVCNKFDKESKDAIYHSENLIFNVNDYVEIFEDYWKEKTQKFINSPGLQNLSFTVL